MTIWRKLIDRLRTSPKQPQRLDYLNEALALERVGDYTAALTSYRLGLRDNPNDPRILQNMGIAFTKTGQIAEAVRHYKKALELDGSLSGAHYGVAFLLVKQGEYEKAAIHLRAFLSRPPKGPDADRWTQHAETVLQQLEDPAESRVHAVASL